MCLVGGAKRSDAMVVLVVGGWFVIESRVGEIFATRPRIGSKLRDARATSPANAPWHAMDPQDCSRDKFRKARCKPGLGSFLPRAVATRHGQDCAQDRLCHRPGADSLVLPLSRPDFCATSQQSIAVYAMFTAGRRAVSALTRPRLFETATPAFARSPAALRRLLSALAVLEQRDGKLNVGSLSAITAAQKLGGPIHAFVAGSSIKAVAEEAAKVEGIEKVIAVDNGAYDKVCFSCSSP